MGYRREELLLRLAMIVGEPRALSLVADAQRAVGGAVWNEAVAAAVLDRLATTPGAVGVVARSLMPIEPKAAVVHPAGPSGALLKLTGMLGAALGDAKARALVDDVVRRKHLVPETFGRDDAFVVLEELARVPGVVGTVARFAKARVHLEVA